MKAKVTVENEHGDRFVWNVEDAEDPALDRIGAALGREPDNYVFNGVSGRRAAVCCCRSGPKSATYVHEFGCPL